MVVRPRIFWVSPLACPAFLVANPPKLRQNPRVRSTRAGVLPGRLSDGGRALHSVGYDRRFCFSRVVKCRRVSVAIGGLVSGRRPALVAAIAAGMLFLCASGFASAAPIIHWGLDESSGNIVHDSAAGGGAQDGTSGVASPQWQPLGGIIGGAVRLSPTSQTD